MSKLAGLHINVGGVSMETPVIIASGVWPMNPSLWPKGSLEGVGAICSKAITLEPRAGNRGNRLRETHSGLLNSIGLQNGGAVSFIENDLPALSSSGKPVVANIAFETLDELRMIIERLNSCRDMIGAIEMNVSCPNVSMGGMAWGMDKGSLERSVTAARSLWEGPLWVKLSPQAPSIATAARICETSGAQAVVVGNTWLGMAMDNDREEPFFDRVFAGLSGPAIFPLSLRLVWEAAGSVNIPVVGCGGICGPEEALSMFLAGASAVALGTGLFLDSRIPSSTCEKLSEHMKRRSIPEIKDLAGRGRHFRRLQGGA
ncbi:MAG: dihydroorotate dehydrogenase [Thermovirgaceae bacterium]|nr:dihydroorotate dehydrogenase [Thermovirgaceae bacterium]